MEEIFFHRAFAEVKHKSLLDMFSASYIVHWGPRLCQVIRHSVADTFTYVPDRRWRSWRLWEYPRRRFCPWSGSSPSVRSRTSPGILTSIRIISKEFISEAENFLHGFLLGWYKVSDDELLFSSSFLLLSEIQRVILLKKKHMLAA